MTFLEGMLYSQLSPVFPESYNKGSDFHVDPICGRFRGRKDGGDLVPFLSHIVDLELGPGARRLRPFLLSGGAWRVDTRTCCQTGQYLTVDHLPPMKPFVRRMHRRQRRILSR